MEDDPHLASTLTTLLHGAPVGRSVSVAAIRAVYEAWAQQPPGLVALITNAGGRLDGDQARDLPAAPTPATEQQHADVVTALRAGSIDTAATIAELVRHAVQLQPSEAERTIVAAITTLAGPEVDAAVHAMQDELEHAPVEAPGRLALFQELARLAIHAHAEDAWPLTSHALDVATARDAHEETARIAFAGSLIGPLDQVDVLRQRALDRSTTGWGIRARAEAHIDAGDVAQAMILNRAALRHAIATHDTQLEASALIPIVNVLARAGDIRRAITLQQRAQRIALQGRAWREYMIGNVNLVWMLVEQLELREASARAQEMARIMAEQGLSRYQLEGHILDAHIALLGGDMARAVDALKRAEPEQLDVDDEDAAWDAVYHALRFAEVSIASADATAARVAYERARALVEAHGFEEQQLELQLLAMSVGDPDEQRDAVGQLPGLLGSSDAVLDAAALTLLSRRVSIDAAADLEESLRAVIAAADPSRAPIVALAVREATAVTYHDADELEQVASAWQVHGFRLDAALARVAAGSQAALHDDGVGAARLLELAHRELAQLGSAPELDRLRALRRRVDQRAGQQRSGTQPMLSPAAVDAFIALSVEQVIPAGVVFSPDDVGLLHGGVARIERFVHDDTWETVDVQVPGDVINAVTALDGRRDHGMRVVAESSCITSTVPVAVLADALQDTPMLLEAFAALAARDVRRTARLLAIRDLPQDARTAALVLDLADIGGVSRSSDGEQLQLRLTREQMGAMIGASRVTITRSLNRLRDGGVLAMDGHRIRIADRDALQQAARGR